MLKGVYQLNPLISDFLVSSHYFAKHFNDLYKAFDIAVIVCVEVILTDDDLRQPIQVHLQLSEVLAQLRFPPFVQTPKINWNYALALLVHLSQKFFNTSVNEADLAAGVL